MIVRVGYGTSSNAPDLQPVFQYLENVRVLYGKKAPGRIVSEISAEARKVFYRTTLNGGYHWRDNPQGQLAYGTKGAGRPSWQRRAWSQKITTDNSGMRGSGRRMVGFSVKTVGTRGTAKFTSFPMNLWEEDVTYRNGSWGPWRKGMTRQGLHWIRKFEPQVAGVIPSAFEKAVAKLNQEGGFDK